MFQRARFISPNLNAWCLCLVSSIVKSMQCGHARLRMRKGVAGHVSRLNEFHGQIKSNEVKCNQSISNRCVCVCACVRVCFPSSKIHWSIVHLVTTALTATTAAVPVEDIAGLAIVGSGLPRHVQTSLSKSLKYCIKNLWRSLKRSFKCWIACTETLPNCPNPNHDIDIHRHTEHGFPVQWQAFFWQASKAFFSASAKLSLCAKGLNKNRTQQLSSIPQGLNRPQGINLPSSWNLLHYVTMLLKLCLTDSQPTLHEGVIAHAMCWPDQGLQGLCGEKWNIVRWPSTSSTVHITGAAHGLNNWELSEWTSYDKCNDKCDANSCHLLRSTEANSCLQVMTIN